jgi:hypothetical protein
MKYEGHAMVNRANKIVRFILCKREPIQFVASEIFLRILYTSGFL